MEQAALVYNHGSRKEEDGKFTVALLIFVYSLSPCFFVQTEDL